MTATSAKSFPGDAPPSLTLERLATPLGEMLIVTAGERVRAIDFSDCEARLWRSLGPIDAVAPRSGPSATARQLEAYFDGVLDAIDEIEIAIGGTAFQRAVWAALRRIAPGTRTSYGALAASLGHPRAARAVGAANAANPVSIVVPCHRLTGVDGALTGYAGGLARKAWLRAHEAQKSRANPALQPPSTTRTCPVT